MRTEATAYRISAVPESQKAPAIGRGFLFQQYRTEGVLSAILLPGIADGFILYKAVLPGVVYDCFRY
jgi:hypothetical protein